MATNLAIHIIFLITTIVFAVVFFMCRSWNKHSKRLQSLSRLTRFDNDKEIKKQKK